MRAVQASDADSDGIVQQRDATTGALVSNITSSADTPPPPPPPPPPGGGTEGGNGGGGGAIDAWFLIMLSMLAWILGRAARMRARFG